MVSTGERVRVRWRGWMRSLLTRSPGGRRAYFFPFGPFPGGGPFPFFSGGGGGGFGASLIFDGSWATWQPVQSSPAFANSCASFVFAAPRSWHGTQMVSGEPFRRWGSEPACGRWHFQIGR